MELNLNPGKQREPLNEDKQLYNPSGIEIHYGYDGRAVYGAIGPDKTEFPFTAIQQTPGLHNIQLSRALEPGEQIVLHWRNNSELVICGETLVVRDDKGNPTGETKKVVKVKIPVGGTYQEVGKWADETGNSEHVLPTFEDSVLTKRFDYIETRALKEI